MGKLNNLKKNISNLLPSHYYEQSTDKWFNVVSGEFDLSFDTIEAVFDYYSHWTFDGGNYLVNYAFLDGMLAKEIVATNKLDFDSPSANYIKNWIVNGYIPVEENKEEVLHKFSYVVNISANPAVLKVYAKNDAIEKCSLDADKYVDTDLNKVVYTATYANGATATIDYWSYDENEELVVYQNLNCTLGERIQSW